MLARTLAITLAVPLAVAGGAVAHPGAGGGSPPVPPASEIVAGATFVFNGHGWGHGIGMSQYGALGYARHGFTYDQILAHYYPGTQLGPAPLTKVRVLLAQGKRKLTVASDEAFTVKDATGEVQTVPAGKYALGPALKLRLAPDAEAKPLAGPLTFSPGSAPLSLGRAYRGTIQVGVVAGKLQAINTVGLESYLYGVVPREMPRSWPLEALEAQAVAARSYAMVTRRAGAFDLFSDTRSQVYGGLDAESPLSNQAVDATAGQVLLYGGDVATTYFFSTSGGRTAAITDVWPNASPVPYLVSVDDPYDTLSPYHDWGPVLVPGSKVTRALKVPGPALDLRTTRNASQRVSTLTALGSRGQVSVSGQAARAELGLRSTWFDVGVLSLSVSGTPVTFGAQVKVAGIVRGLDDVSLQQRVSPSPWQGAPVISPAADGTFTFVAKLAATTFYRLASGSISSSPLRIRVAPLVRIAGSQAGVSGTVKPLLPGAQVLVERLLVPGGTEWAAVGRATLDAAGAFAVPLQLAPGSYRARVPAFKGFAPGISPVLQVGAR